MSTYRTSLSPHLRASDSVPRRLWMTAAALIPALAAAFFWFRWDAVRIVSASILTAVVTELLSSQLLGKKIALYNGSTVLTAFIFSMLMPPGVSFWIVIAGSFAAVFFGKEIFGGLGANPFQSALLGVSFLWVGFPEWMNLYKEPITGIIATHPLSQNTQQLPASLPAVFLGSYAGTIGATSSAALLLGGLALIWGKAIDWRSPFIFLGGIFLFSQILGLDPWFHILCGSTFLAAFFLITDSVTTPVTAKGNYLFAFGAALGTIFLRQKTSLGDSVPFAILFMNAFTPWIDEWIRPKRAAALQKK